jgi:hypothetical protein
MFVTEYMVCIFSFTQITLKSFLQNGAVVLLKKAVNFKGSVVVCVKISFRCAGFCERNIGCYLIFTHGHTYT